MNYRAKLNAIFGKDEQPEERDHSALCPRCEERRFTPYQELWHEGEPGRPALSRTDNETYICSTCGTQEGLEDYAGHVTPQEKWPLTAGARKAIDLENATVTFKVVDEDRGMPF